MTRSLFESDEVAGRPPLAERMRPDSLQEVVGQRKLLGSGKLLARVQESGEIPSLILWGPPGVGKTTIARLLAAQTDAHFVSLSAVLSGIRDVRKVVEEALGQRRLGRRTVLFVDEIHRFNKAQQDAFLPHVESGLIVLIGATTENPSFEVISPLLSRSRVLVLETLSVEDLLLLLERALADEKRGLGGSNIEVNAAALRQLAAYANGDARTALNALEIAAGLLRPGQELDTDIVRQALQTPTLRYDKTGEEHFNLISALHKSLRNSDVDASLYWLARMLEAGEDPLYIARRLVRFASEDVGLADPGALGLAIDGLKAFQFVGLPEGKLALAQVVVYLAQTDKSNAIYRAYSKASGDVARTLNEPVPLALRNAPTSLMKELEYGKGYRYAHSEAEGVADIDCLPENLKGHRYYEPTSSGAEEAVAKKLEVIAARKSSAAEKQHR